MKLTLSSKDFKAIAVLHIQGIPAGFLSSLGQGFLSRLYKGIAAAPNSCVLIERNEQGEVIGFVSGTLDIRKCYMHVLTHHCFSLGIAIIPSLFSSGTVRKVFETLFYAKDAPLKKGGQGGIKQEKRGRGDFSPLSSQERGRGVRSELLSIAVSDSAQGKGIGKKLVQRLECFFQDHGYQGVYKVVTAANDSRSNAFYTHTGFMLHHEFMYHGNSMHEYRKKLLRQSFSPLLTGEGGEVMIDALSQFFNVSPASVTLWSKGRIGLYALLKAMGIGPGSTILMSGYTCVMVPSAPLFLGAKCQYIDIDPETYNIDPSRLALRLVPRASCLILQHTYGIAQDMDQILAWAQANNMPLIEDCCHAFGSTYKGRLCGTFGLGSFFSGQWNKPFSTGLGGILLVNDSPLNKGGEGGSLLDRVSAIHAAAAIPSLSEELRIAAQIKAYNLLVNPKTNALITQAYRALTKLGLAVGSSSNEEFAGTMPREYLKKMAKSQITEGEKNTRALGALLAHRKKITAFYDKELLLAGFKPLKKQPHADNVILRYPVRVANKDQVLQRALRKGYEIGSWFEIPLHPKGIDMERFGYKIGMCPESERACREVINLPTHGRINEREASRHLEFLKKFALPAA
ncbi:MAG: hypothetical protein A2268_09345 [Candidatus Raymondbacteria bacterium RifOxyA12_full_50_37]|uniref:N-acetyltransferase domain-containing protein n=1 Tax=Candidatus Raymondbacteria bacterium RIFOXYD12_FULL_49_13 TaxID=1817890 RepID=A0A1F7FLU7_UNCRA|nr:MAG: hypothetical protein A2268_09345 [Candidatus Raymondbacteria bacterium RifOxyA12_full_50_37]OGJ93444.1 MAG: hypothetical protein A2487_21000 [Candidatus Raymondbacteria bacterium RifOxyC12_full_50_8]OGJ93951.1 MAG: hypothetical protein A2248_06950 [Candidatus Raymondbacteria bacterium RIFOXYA2_FULL_49_16]OGJ98180.1 MAG: hypothetical protein A2453_00215 [Candidatus Raymondbacteria bacterium RIFOXYC2_FULL_50_21]OGK03495.1 MAG: hypothetical protein A2350_15975 [Candidatus Raymondbacteria b